MTVSTSEADDDALPISGLQHLAFCPRQWALIHLEQVWVENLRTAEGRLLHERADLPGESRRAGLRTVRGRPSGGSCSLRTMSRVLLLSW